jgi:hypothetical protein
MGKLLALTAKIRLGWKSLPGTKYFSLLCPFMCYVENSVANYGSAFYRTYEWAH